eukprot:scaffold227_cov19-Tisochrysis_lutea.AAC.5
METAFSLQWEVESGGGVEVKGKGRMDTFIWDPEEDSSYTMPPDMAAAIALAKVGEGVTGGCAPKNGNL